MKHHLLNDAIHLATRGVTPVPDFGHDYETYIKRCCTEDDPGRLLTMAETTEPWAAWEIHPGGDEIVIVLRGRARFIQEIDGLERVVEVGPNEAIINPAGVAHTADVIEPFTALYITPAPGTVHRPRRAQSLTEGRDGAR